MKKILILTIAILFIISLLPFSSIASSTENLSIETNASFINNNYHGKTDEQIFEEKMSVFSMSDKMYDMIRKQVFDAVVSSSSITASSSYFIESESELIQTNKLTYKNRVKEVKADNEQILKNLQNLDLSYRTLATNTSTGPEVSYSVDSGTLNMTIMLITSDNVNYACIGIFQWETMPMKRHTDAFGLTRGNNLTIVGNSAYGAITEYYSVTNSSPVSGATTDHSDDISYTYGDLKNSSDGHAIEFNLPNNYSTGSLSYMYSEVLGCISFEGMIGVDNIVSTNHFAAYAHKVKTITFTSIDFSVSFPKSFSLGGFKVEDTYIQRSTNHTWIR